MTYKIRNVMPTLKDAQEIAPLIHMAIEDVATFFTGSPDPLALVPLIIAKQTRFSHEFGLVVTHQEGQNDNHQETIVAAAFAYPQPLMATLTHNTLALVPGRLSAITSAATDWEEAPPGAFYIDNIAVLPDHRGKALAHMLIQAFEDQAKEENFPFITLLADTTNPKAQALYERLGYKPKGFFKVHGHNYQNLEKPLK